jgi:hypothetical protein
MLSASGQYHGSFGLAGWEPWLIHTPAGAFLCHTAHAACYTRHWWPAQSRFPLGLAGPREPLAARNRLWALLLGQQAIKWLHQQPRNSSQAACLRGEAAVTILIKPFLYFMVLGQVAVLFGTTMRAGKLVADEVCPGHCIRH